MPLNITVKIPKGRKVDSVIFGDNTIFMRKEDREKEEEEVKKKKMNTKRKKVPKRLRAA